ncbi:hypothetical protein FE810_02540 [Thalassotalea litorea]|uniref:Uncharacterized protein n=1 Tax=Thalassotalea litorea TaxID=2020715 RepID=A0A5R9IPI1_9GAMM|nr:hypothetical protein [Thalassotalea litorea]TLU67182.1 hypothetical protein FE810_02540 [Thalassotalea litorea]
MKHLSIAVILTILFVFILTFAVTFIDSRGTDFSFISYSFFVAGLSTTVCAIVIVVWAFPVHFLLNKYKKFNLGWYCLAAIIPAFVFIYAFKPFGNDSSFYLLFQALYCSFIGALAACVFWCFSVYRVRMIARS